MLGNICNSSDYNSYVKIPDVCRVLEGLLIFSFHYFYPKRKKRTKGNALKGEQNLLDNQYLKQSLYFAHVERMHQAFIETEGRIWSWFQGAFLLPVRHWAALCFCNDFLGLTRFSQGLLSVVLPFAKVP